jgi:peptidoglycan-associated lipoprotein
VLVANGVVANVSLVSLGESSPVCTEKTKDCWSKNRRVEHDLSK